MCTLTWKYDQDEYLILFNRDEKRTRHPARPPEVVELDGTRILTPIDGNAGGSWLAVNEHGLTVSILNYYEADARMPDDGMKHKSRGRLVLDLAVCANMNEVADKLSEITSTDFRPFFLVVFGFGGDVRLIKWDGINRTEEALSEDKRPLTTSSFHTKEVIDARTDKFREYVEKYNGDTSDMLRAFQHSRDELGGAFSVTMTRDDAQTVSYSEVSIRNDKISYFYQPREMDLNDPPYLNGETYHLKRA